MELLKMPEEGQEATDAAANGNKRDNPLRQRNVVAAWEEGGQKVAATAAGDLAMLLGSPQSLCESVMTPRNDVVTDIYFPAASNALWISDDAVPGIGEDGRRSEGEATSNLTAEQREQRMETPMTG
eukprot:gene34863-45115_t